MQFFPISTKLALLKKKRNVDMGDPSDKQAKFLITAPRGLTGKEHKKMKESFAEMKSKMALNEKHKVFENREDLMKCEHSLRP